MEEKSLHEFAKRGNVENLKKRLSDPCCDINHQLNNGGASALIFAAYNGKEECVKLLLAAGADLSIKDKDGTALDNATDEGHKNIVRLIEEEEIRRQNPWQKVDDESIANIQFLPIIEQKITRVFNLRAMTMKEVTQNRKTKAESSFLLHFSDPAVDRELIKQAQEEFVKNDGVIKNEAEISNLINRSSVRVLTKTNKKNRF